MHPLEAIRNSKSLLAKHLTPELWESLSPLLSPGGFSLEEQIASGIANPDSAVGIYLKEGEAYHSLAPLLHPIIADYHGLIPHDQPRGFPPAGALSLKDSQERIQTSRIRVARNLAGHSFVGGMSLFERLELEAEVKDVLAQLDGPLQGTYRSLKDISPDEQLALRAKSHLFQEPDRFLTAGGLAQDWPEGRGIFANKDHSFMVWVGEEDHLRVMTLLKGNSLDRAASLLEQGLAQLGQGLNFSFDPELGYLSSCPSNLGTGMRAGVHLRLPEWEAKGDLFKTEAQRLGLQLRGTGGEHTQAKGSVYDLSNLRRLGVSEAEILQGLVKGLEFFLDEDQWK